MATINAVNTSLSGQSGTGSFAGTTSPTFVTPTLGAALATSINFGGLTLSNYSTGGWTPIDASGASLSLTASGAYIRIGNIVVATCIVTYPATANGSSAAIGGLPFATPNSNAYQAGTVIYASAPTLSYCATTANTTTFGLATSAGGAVVNSVMSGTTSQFEFIYQF